MKVYVVMEYSIPSRNSDKIFDVCSSRVGAATTKILERRYDRFYEMEEWEVNEKVGILEKKRRMRHNK